MLPKNRRIERKDFDQIVKTGKRYNSPSFFLYVSRLNNPKEISSRFSFSVSKKVSRLAVNRNKLRRRGYSIISKNINKIKPGFLYFFSYKKDYEKDFGLLEKEIIKLLSPDFVIV